MSRISRNIAAMAAAMLLVVGGSVGVATVGADDATETVEGTFSMLSYNVAGLPEVLSDSNPSVNMALIGPLLDAYDVVLTQEDFANPDPPLDDLRVYHDILLETTDFPYVSIAQEPPFGTNPHNPDAIVGDGLNFFSRFPLGPVERIIWDDCMGVATNSSDCLATKGFAVTTIELGPGATVDVYDLHADAGGAMEDQQTRESNFAQLAAYIVEHSAGHAVIIGGDTNLHTDRAEAAETWQTFLAVTGLADVCDTVDCGDDVDVIDKIAFRSGGNVDLEAASHVFERERFTRDDGEPLSDHDPLHVTFAYTATVTPTTTTTTSTSTPAQAPGGGTGPQSAPAPAAAAVRATPAYTG